MSINQSIQYCSIILFLLVFSSSIAENKKSHYEKQQTHNVKRNSLLARPTVRELQVDKRIASPRLKVNINNQDRDNNTIREKKANKFENSLFLHYPHEKRLQGLKRDIHKIYSETFQGSPTMNVRLIHCRTSKSSYSKKNSNNKQHSAIK